MGCHLGWIVMLCAVSTALAGQQKVMLSDSYLPVAMQVIANLVDQMAYETKDEPAPTSRPTSRPTSAPTSRPTSASTSRPITAQTSRPTTAASWSSSKPPAQYLPWKPQGGGWSMDITGSTPKPQQDAIETTTPFHRPGLFAPERPPRPNERLNNRLNYILLPLESDPEEYTVIKPDQQKNMGALLSLAEHGEVKPILENRPKEDALLPHFNRHIEDAYPRSTEHFSLELGVEELSENNLQYVSEDLKEMLKLAHDPNDERAFDIDADGSRKVSNFKAKLSQSNLRMQLLYDLLSREAKRQKLSDFGGFQASVIKEMQEAGASGARAQLGFALARMLERKDSQHEYANNRAREMVAELKKDESLLSSETRYLQPLAYKVYS